MKQTIEDKLVSKVSKGKLNTIHVSREEMASGHTVWMISGRDLPTVMAD